MLIFNVQFLVYKITFVFAVYIYLSIHLSDNKLHKDFFFLSELTLIILDSLKFQIHFRYQQPNYIPVLLIAIELCWTGIVLYIQLILRLFTLQKLRSHFYEYGITLHVFRSSLRYFNRLSYFLHKKYCQSLDLFLDYLSFSKCLLKISF